MKAQDLVYMLCKHQISVALSDLNLVDPNSEKTPSEESIQELKKIFTENSLIRAGKDYLIIVQGPEGNEGPEGPGGNSWKFKGPGYLKPSILDIEINEGIWVYISSNKLHIFLWLTDMNTLQEFIENTKDSDHSSWIGIINTDLNTVDLKETAQNGKRR